MDLSFLESLECLEDIEIQYNPKDEKEAIRLKDLIEFELQSFGNEDEQIKYAMIYYVSFKNDYVNVMTANQTYVCSMSKEEVKNCLKNDYFIRIQDDVWVHCYYIDRINRDCLYLINGQKLDIDNQYNEELKKYENRMKG